MKPRVLVVLSTVSLLAACAADGPSDDAPADLTDTRTLAASSAEVDWFVAAKSALSTLPSALALGPRESWVRRGAPFVDADGTIVLRFDRTLDGLIERGADFAVELTGGVTTLKLAALHAPMRTRVDVSTKPKTTEAAARVLARKALGASDTADPALVGKLVVWALGAYARGPQLAWEYEVAGRHVVVSASSAAVIADYGGPITLCGVDATCTRPTVTTRGYYDRQASTTAAHDGTSYLLEDPSRRIQVWDSTVTRRPWVLDPATLVFALAFGATIEQLENGYAAGGPVRSPTAAFGDGLWDRAGIDVRHRATAATDALLSLQKTYDWFRGRGRYGFDGFQSVCASGWPNPVVWPCFVPATHAIRATTGLPVFNAAYLPTTARLVFGDGVNTPGVERGAALTDLETVAHEYTHGVTASAAGLEYTNAEAGALNESFSDVLAKMVRFSNDPSSYADASRRWMMGNAFYTPTTLGDALRYLDDPARDGVSRARYADLVPGSTDPHEGSGIPNKAFSLFADSNVGWARAGEVFYRALTRCLTTGSTMSYARACTDFTSRQFDPTGAQASQLARAWDAVGVPVCPASWECPGTP